MQLFKAIALFAIMAASQSYAGEVIVGVGADDVVHSESSTVAAQLEVRSEPVWMRGAFAVRAGGALEIDGDADIWGGLGIVATYDLTENLRLEGSFMPGFYSETDDGTDLGHSLEFRSQAAVSYQFMQGKRLGVAFEHKSNANIGDKNPGIETAFVTLSSTF